MKPVVIEAYQFVGGSAEPGWPDGWLTVSHVFSPDGEQLFIPTPEGDHIARVGDYIIKGVRGEFYPCKPDIFAETYEAVEDSESVLPWDRLASAVFGRRIHPRKPYRWSKCR